MNPFEYSKFFAKKKFLKIFGGEVRIYDEAKNQLLFFVKQKAFKLKEDITVFADESENTPLLRIQARSILDFGATYDVVDARNGQKVGAIQRKMLHSILRDQWEIRDFGDKPIAKVTEDNIVMAMARRFLTALIPESFDIVMNDKVVGELRQSFNPFVPQFSVDFSMDSGSSLDRRLGIATVILLQMIEGKQQSFD